MTGSLQREIKVLARMDSGLEAFLYGGTETCFELAFFFPQLINISKNAKTE